LHPSKKGISNSLYIDCDDLVGCDSLKHYLKYPDLMIFDTTTGAFANIFIIKEFFLFIVKPLAGGKKRIFLKAYWMR
jgi:hypothetical protein